MGRLHERVDACGGFEACVRSAPGDVDGEGAATLACGLQGAVVTGALEHEDCTARQGALLEERAGRAGTDLFVGSDEHLDPGQVIEGGQTVHGLDQSSEHVEDTRAGCPSVVHGEGAQRRGAEGKDGVVVTEDEHPGLTRARPVNVGAGLAVDEPRASTEATFEQGGNSDRRRGHGGDVARGRLDVHQRLEVLEHCLDAQRGHPGILPVQPTTWSRAVLRRTASDRSEARPAATSASRAPASPRRGVPAAPTLDQ